MRRPASRSGDAQQRSSPLHPDCDGPAKSQAPGCPPDTNQEGPSRSLSCQVQSDDQSESVLRRKPGLAQPVMNERLPSSQCLTLTAQLATGGVLVQATARPQADRHTTSFEHPTEGFDPRWGRPLEFFLFDRVVSDQIDVALKTADPIPEILRSSLAASTSCRTSPVAAACRG